MKSNCVKSVALLAMLGMLAMGRAQAQGLPGNALERRCWLGYTAERSAIDMREPTAVRFVNLRNGYALRSPFMIEFGVRGMGVVPAGNPTERAGHHHLLIDTPLPRNHQEKIPFSDKHKHFGKGQTGTVLDLPPGAHTLRLLFADHDHRPYFVYSPEITVHVLGTRTAAPIAIDPAQFENTCSAWYQDQVSAPRGGAKEVYAKNLRDGEAVSSPFVLSLGAIGMGIAPAGRKLPDTGHFAVTVLRAGGTAQRLVLADGRTETTLDLARGDYELEIALLDADNKVALKSAPLRLSVTRQDR